MNDNEVERRRKAILDCMSTWKDTHSHDDALKALDDLCRWALFNLNHNCRACGGPIKLRLEQGATKLMPPGCDIPVGFYCPKVECQDRATVDCEKENEKLVGINQ